MKLKLIILLSLALLISCSKKEKDFDSFEYTYSGTFSTVFSLKITDKDSVFLREHWNNGNIEYPKSETNYFAIINEKQRTELTKLIRKIDFRKINSEYYENYLDGSAFQIFIRKGKFEKRVLVHSYKIPKELESLSDWLNNTKQNLKLTKTSKNLKFISADGILPPPPPPPIEKVQFIKK